MRRAIAAALTALGLAVLAGAVTLTEDSPPLEPPQPGEAAGTIRPADRVAELSAVSRASGKTYRPDVWDKATGRFAFRRLPGDATYDVCLKTAGGRTIEGIDLDFVDARMVRLAALRREQLGLPPDRQHRFGAADVEELLAYVRDLKDFMELRRVLYLRGHGRRATMLVELMRARDFYHSKDSELIWRVELWYFENQFGGWERPANQEQVLRRERIPEPAWRKIDVEWYPQLSVHVDPDGRSKPVDFEIPARPDPSRGRPANTDIEVKTTPHISGLDDEPPPASQPASQTQP